MAICSKTFRITIYLAFGEIFIQSPKYVFSYSFGRFFSKIPSANFFAEARPNVLKLTNPHLNRLGEISKMAEIYVFNCSFNRFNFVEHYIPTLNGWSYIANIKIYFFNPLRRKILNSLKLYIWRFLIGPLSDFLGCWNMTEADLFRGWTFKIT